MNGENQKVTNEELAQTIAKGFEGVDRRFDQVDRELNEMEERITMMEKGISQIKNLIIIQNQRRIEKLEAEMEDIRGLLAMK